MGEAKAATNGKAVQIEYRQASAVANGLAALANLLPLPLPVAMRCAVLQEQAQRAATVHQNAARVRQVEIGKGARAQGLDLSKESPAFDLIQTEADLEFAKEGEKEVALNGGRVTYGEIETAIATWRKRQEAKEAKDRELEPPGLGNILAMIRPVLEPAPEVE